MTEITFRAMLMQRPEGSVIGNWWASVDRWTLGAVVALFATGIVLGLAASPPLAEKNGLDTPCSEPSMCSTSMPSRRRRINCIPPLLPAT